MWNFKWLFERVKHHDGTRWIILENNCSYVLWGMSKTRWRFSGCLWGKGAMRVLVNGRCWKSEWRTYRAYLQRWVTTLIGKRMSPTCVCPPRPFTRDLINLTTFRSSTNYDFRLRRSKKKIIKNALSLGVRSVEIYGRSISATGEESWTAASRSLCDTPTLLPSPPTCLRTSTGKLWTRFDDSQKLTQ